MSQSVPMNDIFFSCLQSEDGGQHLSTLTFFFITVEEHADAAWANTAQGNIK